MGSASKTKPQTTSVSALVAAVSSEALRLDCFELVDLFGKASGEPAVVWGGSIIGFGQYAYIYASGHGGTAAKIGFAARKSGLVIYLSPGFEDAADELAALGPHKIGKGCLYLRTLVGIDREVLMRLARQAIARIDQRYPQA